MSQRDQSAFGGIADHLPACSFIMLDGGIITEQRATRQLINNVIIYWIECLLMLMKAAIWSIPRAGDPDFTTRQNEPHCRHFIPGEGAGLVSADHADRTQRS